MWVSQEEWRRDVQLHPRRNEVRGMSGVRGDAVHKSYGTREEGIKGFETKVGEGHNTTSNSKNAGTSSRPGTNHFAKTRCHVAF